MSDTKPPQKGSVLSNLEKSTDAPSPTATTPPNQGRSASPDDKMTLSESKDAADQSNSTKDAEPEAKKRKRSQRACIRCRGQKLKCDGVFPCARCLKLKLVCKEPSEANAGTPTSNRVNTEDRESKANGASYASSVSTRPHSQASIQLAASGLPHPTGPHLYGASMPDGFADRSRDSTQTRVGAHPRQSANQHPSDRFGYSLPDAVRRIDVLERTVSRLAERVEGHAGPLDRNGNNTGVRPASARSGASAQNFDRKRPRADSPDESDAEVDELQDGASEASVPLQMLSQQDAHSGRDMLSVADKRLGPTRASNEANVPTSSSSAAGTAPPGRQYSNGGRHLSVHDPIEAGFITPEMGQMLLEVFLTYCHVFAPFLDLDGKTSVASLSASEPFLLSILLTIGALYQDSHGKGDPSVRSEIHNGLASYALNQLGSQLCSSDHTIGSVQAILLIAHWPQAFPGSPDEKMLASFAANVLQSVSRHYQLEALNGDRNAASLSHRVASLWTSLRAFEALAAIDSGKRMDLTDHDLVLCKAPRPLRSSIPTPYLVRAVPVTKELQMWLSEVSSNSPLSQVELPSPAARPNLTHDWDRFKYLQSQLFDVEKRWLASETDCSRLERIVGLIDRWTLQIYLAAVALKSAEFGCASKSHGADRGPGYDFRYEEESARFVAAYKHDMRQACQVLMDIFTDPEISGALVYAPGYLLRRFGQAASASALLVDFHDVELTRSTQELIYLCSKRFEQLSTIDYSSFAAHLSWFVRSSYEKVGGRSNRDERDVAVETSAPKSVTAIERRRWLGGDLFGIFFGIGLLMEGIAASNSAF
ncbi:uncharacterized protein MEPE_06253 [Melanopsichium pennsylvanicum]|uniref:Zn(2)-C6 fungal-type domain-containing protein n=2 Tax=Melanopsichium pennsylvanicum TaxID=63383 RepID=A0AAJ4XSI6_9BASI|nr:conserved hypothetical protein [Melanopsichium pennsylvanicum 4]SNX87543.1 uncharacterized protein MEPE_06253 [Melanopsichium pennsylvanicum]